VGFEELRRALDNFCVDNLHLVTRLGHELLNTDASLRHPAALFAVTITAQKVALYWDGVPVTEEAASIVESHIRPKMLSVLDAADLDADTVLRAMDDLARSYVDALPFLKAPYR
jgi:hypothetical protein